MNNRLINIENLIHELNITWKELSSLINKNVSHLSQVKNGTRPFTEKLAREIEAKLNLELGHLDRNPQQKETDVIYIPVYDVKASAGNGQIITDENIIGNKIIEKDVIYQKGWCIRNLAVIKVIGDSMVPKLFPNQEVLLDLTKTEPIIDNRIYAIRIGDELKIKKLFKLPNGKPKVISINPEYAHTDGEAPKGSKVIGLAIHAFGFDL